jgi:hypothetical protein
MRSAKRRKEKFALVGAHQAFGHQLMYTILSENVREMGQLAVVGKMWKIIFKLMSK